MSTAEQCGSKLPSLYNQCVSHCFLTTIRLHDDALVVVNGDLPSREDACSSSHYMFSLDQQTKLALLRYHDVCSPSHSASNCGFSAALEDWRMSIISSAIGLDQGGNARLLEPESSRAKMNILLLLSDWAAVCAFGQLSCFASDGGLTDGVQRRWQANQ